MKTANDYLEEANAVVPKITPEAGIEKHKAGNTIFVDVRDSSDIAKSGTIAGAVRVARGMLEFKADETHPLHDANLKKDADLVLVCGAGGQAALGGKTLVDMGFQSVSNVGGISAWKEAGGPMEEGQERGVDILLPREDDVLGQCVALCPEPSMLGA